MYAMERIRFGCVKLSDGRIHRLINAIDLAKADWRDLLMAADFGEDVNAHNKCSRRLRDNAGRPQLTGDARE